jgi:adenylyltransferase/sulfurtransferase
MIGGLQAQEALKLIHGLPVESGCALIYNGVANNFYRTRFQHREDCLSHETYPDPIELPLRADAHTARDLLLAAGQQLRLPAEQARLELDRDLVVSIDCAPCGTRTPVMRPRQVVGHRDAVCASCGQMARPRIEHCIVFDDELAGAQLGELGIPAYDMVRVVWDDSFHVVLLAGDRPAVMSPDLTWQAPGGSGVRAV